MDEYILFHCCMAIKKSFFKYIISIALIEMQPCIYIYMYTHTTTDGKWYYWEISFGKHMVLLPAETLIFEVL